MLNPILFTVLSVAILSNSCLASTGELDLAINEFTQTREDKGHRQSNDESLKDAVEEFFYAIDMDEDCQLKQKEKLISAVKRSGKTRPEIVEFFSAEFGLDNINPDELFE